MTRRSDRAHRRAIGACARALAADASVESAVLEEGAIAEARTASDAAAFSHRLPPPPASAHDPLRTLLHRLRATALGHHDYPGVEISLLTATGGMPPWRAALIRVAWNWLVAGKPPRGDGDPWRARLVAGLEGHWHKAALCLKSAQRFDEALDRLLPLLVRRLAEHGIDLGSNDAHRQDAGDRGEASAAADGNRERAEEGQAEPERRSRQAAASASSARPVPGPESDYRVYSRHDDQELAAHLLLAPAELTALRRRLDLSLDELPPVARRLAARLRRALQARTRRRWRFDREEGVPDAARLAAFIASSDDRRIFKEEERGDLEGAAVTLLVDNSGSMKGRPILLAALCTDLVTRALEQCGVAVEILGFTTRYRDGGPVRAHWERAGRPATPGRLNALHHLIYKPAATPWRRARTAVAAMLHEPLLRENVDGEALLWAHARLLRRPEERRVLLVISDGAPMDESTAEANGRGYLERHLFEVAGWIERRSPVQLLAVGIGHDVNRYYRNAVTIPDAEALAETLLGQLAETLTR